MAAITLVYMTEITIFFLVFVAAEYAWILGIRDPLLNDICEARLYSGRTSELTVETSYATIIFKIGMEC